MTPFMAGVITGSVVMFFLAVCTAYLMVEK
jgi:hypothetical protein